jgi:hypothetical protein
VLLQPTARYWYGRLLVDDPHPAEQARGGAMVTAAATDYRSLETVTYANLAEQFLRRRSSGAEEYRIGSSEFRLDGGHRMAKTTSPNGFC